MAQQDGFIGFPHAKSIVVSGDIHGDIAPLVNKCCVQYGMTDTLIIVAGDCGFGFERPGYYEAVYKRCSSRLSKANCWLAFVRGNHDNPAYFENPPVKHQRWMTLADYTVIKACGHSILCVGGATSIDRTRRMEAKQYRLQKTDDPFMPNVYWPNEQPVYDEKKLDCINEKFAIDVVITHTARKVMDDLYNYLYSKNHPLSYWYYGHFHESWHARIDDVMFHMLDIMELIEIR